jgi:hypothetical protein
MRKDLVGLTVVQVRGVFEVKVQCYRLGISV